MHLFVGLRKHGDVLARRMATVMGLQAPPDDEAQRHPDGRGERQRGLAPNIVQPTQTEGERNVTNPLPVLEPVRSNGRLV